MKQDSYSFIFYNEIGYIFERNRILNYTVNLIKLAKLKKMPKIKNKKIQKL